jgi:hypothetical protein
MGKRLKTRIERANAHKGLKFFVSCSSIKLRS